MPKKLCTTLTVTQPTSECNLISVSLTNPTISVGNPSGWLVIAIDNPNPSRVKATLRVYVDNNYKDIEYPLDSGTNEIKLSIPVVITSISPVHTQDGTHQICVEIIKTEVIS